MLFLMCPSDLQCIGSTIAVKTTCLQVGWAVEGMGVGLKINHQFSVIKKILWKILWKILFANLLQNYILATLYCNTMWFPPADSIPGFMYTAVFLGRIYFISFLVGYPLYLSWKDTPLYLSWKDTLYIFLGMISFIYFQVGYPLYLSWQATLYIFLGRIPYTSFQLGYPLYLSMQDILHIVLGRIPFISFQVGFLGFKLGVEGAEI